MEVNEQAVTNLLTMPVMPSGMADGDTDGGAVVQQQQQAYMQQQQQGLPMVAAASPVVTAAASATPAAPAPAPAPVATTSTANPVAGEQPIAGLINCEFALSFKICRACC